MIASASTAFRRVALQRVALAVVVFAILASGCGGKSKAAPTTQASSTRYTTSELKRVFRRAGITVGAFPIPPVFIGTSRYSERPVVYLVITPTAQQAHGPGMTRYLRTFDTDFAHALTERQTIRNVEILIPKIEPARAHQQVLAAVRSLQKP